MIFTFGKPIGENQAIAWMIADSDVEIEAARWLVLKAAWTVDQGLDPRHSSSMAKLFGANMANHVIDKVMHGHGGMGYTRGCPSSAGAGGFGCSGSSRGPTRCSG